MTTKSLGRFLLAVLAGACLFVACETHQKPPLLGASSGLYVAPQSVGSLTSSIQWTKGTAAPTLSQATQTTDVAPPSITLLPSGPYASAATNLVSGSVVVNIPTSVGGAIGYGALQIKTGATSILYIQPYPDGEADFGGIYAGGITQGLTNYMLLGDVAGTTAILNASTTTSMRIANVHEVDVTTSSVAMAPPLGGLNTTPFSWKGETSPNTVACGTGGTQTISAAQAIIPFFIVTGSGLTSNCTLDFSTNASTGHFEVGTSGLTLGATFGLVIKNGTTSSTTFTTANAVAGSTMAIVNTYGTNNLAVNF